MQGRAGRNLDIRLIATLWLLIEWVGEPEVM